MIEVVIQIPIADNDGQRFPDAAWDAFEETLLLRFGGFTRLADAKGAWRDPQTERVYWDVSRMYSVGIPDYPYPVVDSAIPRPVQRLLRDFNPTFRQEAYAIRFLGRLDIFRP